ncbi:MAG: septum formation initiator family protein [Lachnospiraceae bacterium]|nr:septum formation initiator family protein [Lachnospiraceae bacterium]
MKNDELKKNNVNLNTETYSVPFEDGSAARVLEEYSVQTEPVRIPREHEIKRYEPEPGYEGRVKPGVGRAVDLFFAGVLAVAIMVTLYICINYLQIQSDIVQLEKQITSLDNAISATESENNALESSLNTVSYDLDYVYDVAVGALGMVYPNKNEIHFYENEGSSYYRDYSARN